MGITHTVIETGVDKLVNLINKKGSIPSNDAALALGVSNTVIMEWADFLEEEGIISIEYKFTKPILVARKLGKKDTQERAKEFSGKKEIFVRKAEGSLSFIDSESKKLLKIKEDFEKIKKELGFDLEGIRNEFEELKKYEQLKINLDKQVEEQKATALNKLQAITKQLSREKLKYQDILSEIGKEEQALEKEKHEVESMEQTEKFIDDKLASLKEIIKKVDAKAGAEQESIRISESNIQRLKLLADSMQSKVKNEKDLIDPLVKESEIQTEKIKKLQSTIIQKIMAKEKKMKGAKKVSQKMRAFFKKKLGVLDLLDKINKDRNLLENELIDLIKKSKSFQLSSNSGDTASQIEGLEKKFNEVDQKKKVFEKELKKLNTFF
ncbi:MAG: hypothetical protein V1831_01035 [Candidatus Woesearchaeota archaeon]